VRALPVSHALCDGCLEPHTMCLEDVLFSMKASSGSDVFSGISAPPSRIKNLTIENTKMDFFCSARQRSACLRISTEALQYLLQGAHFQAPRQG
jgi:hypothetical protein